MVVSAQHGLVDKPQVFDFLELAIDLLLCLGDSCSCHTDQSSLCLRNGAVGALCATAAVKMRHGTLLSESSVEGVVAFSPTN